MKHASIIIGAVHVGACVQRHRFSPIHSPRHHAISAPLPPPLPQPKIAPPVIPQMDAPVRQDYAPAPRPSFSDRITTCLNDAAGSGLGPSDRATYFALLRQSVIAARYSARNIRNESCGLSTSVITQPSRAIHQNIIQREARP